MPPSQYAYLYDGEREKYRTWGWLLAIKNQSTTNLLYVVCTIHKDTLISLMTKWIRWRMHHDPQFQLVRDLMGLIIDSETNKNKNTWKSIQWQGFVSTSARITQSGPSNRPHGKLSCSSRVNQTSDRFIWPIIRSSRLDTYIRSTLSLNGYIVWRAVTFRAFLSCNIFYSMLSVDIRTMG